MRFKSTKKPWETKSQSLKKPTSDDVDKCIETMEDVDVAVCGVCFREDDCTGQSLVNWIQCEMCTVWCVDSEPDNIFMCHYCS